MQSLKANSQTLTNRTPKIVNNNTKSASNNCVQESETKGLGFVNNNNNNRIKPYTSAPGRVAGFSRTHRSEEFEQPGPNLGAAGQLDQMQNQVRPCKNTNKNYRKTKSCLITCQGLLFFTKYTNTLQTFFSGSIRHQSIYRVQIESNLMKAIINSCT